MAGWGRLDVASEIRTTKARLKEITGCVASPDSSPGALKLQAEDAALAEEQAAAAVGRATLPRVAPFLAARDDLQRRGEDVLPGRGRPSGARTSFATFSTPSTRSSSRAGWRSEPRR
ncbi:hypothetical protein ACFCYC_26255 [Streptomyces sp. NPDC056402]|uniref:hypothetical protein n=1 Tax=Streptomyces sp. NPDC056402 TaxID=3345810 RepID=UPI0035D5CE7C